MDATRHAPEPHERSADAGAGADARMTGGWPSARAEGQRPKRGPLAARGPLATLLLLLLAACSDPACPDGTVRDPSAPDGRGAP